MDQIWIWTPDGELDGLKGLTKDADWPSIFPTSDGAWYDSQVHQKKNLEPLLDMTHKTNDLEKVFAWIWLTKKLRTSSLNEEQRV